MKKSISKLLEEARSREQARINLSLGAMAAVVQEAPNGTLDIQCLLDQVTAEETWHTVKWIAEKHSIAYSTVWTQLHGKPGFNRHGGIIRVAHFLYRSWLESAVRNGLKP